MMPRNFSLQGATLTKSTRTWASCLIALATALLPSLVAANPLQDLKDSQVMRELRSSKREKPDSGESNSRYMTGLDPTSNLASLWATSSSALALVSWGNIKAPHYSLKRSLAVRAENGVRVDLEIRDSTGFQLAIVIMVPHPTIEPLVQAGMIKEFTQFKLPPEEVETSRSVPLEGGTGTFYQSSKGVCSILIPVAKSGIINVSAKTCLKTDEMIKVVEQFDLVRLNRKLNT